MDEKTLHDLKEALAERRKQIFRATVLDRDNQPLATGEALIEGAPAHGVFWPENPIQKDILPSNAATLRRSDGTEIVLSDFQSCDALHTVVHYHFHVG